MEEQKQYASIQEILAFLEHSELPQDEQRARKVALQSPLFTIIDSVLYYMNPKKNGATMSCTLQASTAEGYGGNP